MIETRLDRTVIGGVMIPASGLVPRSPDEMLSTSLPRATGPPALLDGYADSAPGGENGELQVSTAGLARVCFTSQVRRVAPLASVSSSRRLSSIRTCLVPQCPAYRLISVAE